MRDLAAARATYRALLGCEPGPVEDVPEEKVRVVFFPLGGPGGTRVELLEATAPDSPIARAIEKRGEGIHHVAFAVRDIRGALEGLRAQGVPVLDPEPRLRGEPGHRRLVAFVHPKGAHGVLVELVQYLDAD